MATVHIAFTDARTVGGSSVMAGKPSSAEAITSSGVSQQTTAKAKRGEVAHVASSGGAVYVVAGQNETVAAANGYLVPDGGAVDLGPLNENDEIAVIDA